MAKEIPGTSIIENAEPDSVTAEDQSKYDSDFEYLAPIKPIIEKPEEGKVEEPEPQALPTKDAKEEPAKITEKKPEASEKTTLTVEYESKISQKDIEIRTLQEKIQTLDAQNAGFKELVENPAKALVKYFPSLTEVIDPRRFIEDKLRKEFPELQFDISEAYAIGTPSYKYRIRESELMDELRQTQFQEKERRRIQEETSARVAQESRKKAMETFGLDDKTFEERVIKWSNSNALDWVGITKLALFDEIIKQQVEKSLKARKNGGEPPPKGPANVHAEDEVKEGEVPEHLKDLQDAFGDIV